MRDQVSVSEWLKEDPDTRQKLREVFAIPKTSFTETHNGVLTCDGVSDTDLKALSVGKMIRYLASELPWFHEELTADLLKMTINKIYGRPTGEGFEGVNRFNAAAFAGGREEVSGFDGASDRGTEEAKPRGRGRPRKQETGVSEAPQSL